MTDPSRLDLHPASFDRNSLRQAQMAEALSNYRLTPATLMAKLDPSWIAAKWLQFLSLKIAKCVARGNCGLLISAPPRHGKSMLSTIATPLWVLENFPDKSVVLATYGEELSTDFSRQIRDYIEQNEDLLSLRLRSDAKRTTNMLTTKGGGLKAVGLRGAITGRGADVLVIDDYIKEPKEAESPTYLEDLWTWYRTVARTRLEPGAVVIILATRWVANDLHGRIMKKQKESGRSYFEYIEMPAIATEDDDILGRQKGEVLFPERYNEETILEIKEDVGRRWFNAMFQQKPDDDESQMIKISDFRRITEDTWVQLQNNWNAVSNTVKWGRSWDMASLSDAGDYTSGPLCAYNKDTGEFVITHMVRGQWSPGRVETEFLNAFERDAQNHPGLLTGMEQEPGSSGKFTVKHFEDLLRGSPVKGKKKVTPFPATNSKTLNAQPFAAALEAGKVYIVLENPDDLQVTEADDHTGWVRDFFMEVEKFPEAEFDDQMDAISGTYKLLTGKVHFKASIGRKMGETRAKTAKIGGMSAALDEVHSSLRDETVTNTQGERKKQRGATFGRQFDRTNDIGRLGVG